jgi:GNAT superfamily N-acetyltransferase
MRLGAKPDALSNLALTEFSKSDLSEDRLNAMADIFIQAHFHSNDMPHYQEFSSQQDGLKRLKTLMANQTSPIIEEASYCLSNPDLQGDDLIGGIIFTEAQNVLGFERVAWLMDVFLLPTEHGKGYGRAMIEESLKRLKALGYPLVVLTVSENNPAKHLYSALGFKLLSTTDEYGLLLNATGVPH